MRVVTQDVRSARAASLFRAGGRSENLELGGRGLGALCVEIGFYADIS